MNRRTFALLTAVLTFSVGVVLARLSLPNLFKTPPPVISIEIVKQVQLSNYRLSGPYAFDNLKIFMIHGPDAPDSMLYLPLQDAMTWKNVLVHETDTVNELAIENVSRYEDVFVQAGDIVKGGKQDRVLAVDLILPPNSGRVPISAFCVEQSRWQAREGESADHFTLTEMAATPSLRQVIVDVATQVGVWKEVKASQDKLTVALPANVQSAESPTSLPLALENDTVRQATEPYMYYLYPVPQRWNDVIGFAFAIDDEIKGADVYSSNIMFKRFWYRLLQAAAVEAVATPRTEARDCLSIETVGSFLVNSELGTESDVSIGAQLSAPTIASQVIARTQTVKRETETSLFFETRDSAYNNAWVHRSYLTRLKN